MLGAAAHSLFLPVLSAVAVALCECHNLPLLLFTKTLGFPFYNVLGKPTYSFLLNRFLGMEFGVLPCVSGEFREVLPHNFPKWLRQFALARSM